MTALALKNVRVVRSSWLEEGGRRLDCNPYMSGAREARDALDRLSTPKDRLCDVTTGIFDSGRESRHWVDDQRYGVRYLGSSAISLADFSALPLISNKQVIRNPRLLIEEGWSLITRSGTIGRMAYVRPDMVGLACSEDVLRVVPDTFAISAGYLYAFLASKFGVPLVVSGTYGAIIQHIEREHIAHLPVPRFGDEFERRVASLVDQAARQRTDASAMRRTAIEMIERAIGWTSLGACLQVSLVPSPNTSRRMDAFHHSPGVRAGTAALQAVPNQMLRDLAESVYEPNRGSRLKVTDPAYGVPFLSSSTVFEVNPTGEYLISRSRTPNIEALLLSEADVLLPRSGQIGGVIGRAVLPRGRNTGHAGSEHLVRVRCRSQFDAAYLWSVLASEPGYLAVTGTAFGSSIPSLDAGLIGEIRVPWLSDVKRAEIANLVLKAIEVQDQGTALEVAAVALVEEKISEGA